MLHQLHTIPCPPVKHHFVLILPRGSGGLAKSPAQLGWGEGLSWCQTSSPWVLSSQSCWRHIESHPLRVESSPSCRTVLPGVSSSFTGPTPGKIFLLFYFLLEAAGGQSFQSRGRAASPTGSPMFAWKWLQVVQERLYPWLQALAWGPQLSFLSLWYHGWFGLEDGSGIDASELWCQRRLLRVPWTARDQTKGNQPWMFIGRTDAEAPVLWPPDGKSQLIGKDPNAGKDWGQEEKRATEHEMVGWNYQLNRRVFEQTPGDGEDAAFHGTSKSWTWLSDWTTTTKNSCFFFLSIINLRLKKKRSFCQTFTYDFSCSSWYVDLSPSSRMLISSLLHLSIFLTALETLIFQLRESWKFRETELLRTVFTQWNLGAMDKYSNSLSFR